MYINELEIKEINQYYTQHGGRRTATIKGFANYIETAKAGRISATKSYMTSRVNAAASTASGSFAASETGKAESTANSTHQTYTTEGQNKSSQADSQSAESAGNTVSCCDKCKLTNELMLRMLSGSLYAQSGLGYTTAGSGALAAYQSLSKFFGNNVFS